MSTIFYEFDDEKTAFINPEDTTKADPNFPEVCITTYSEHIIGEMSSVPGVKEIAALYTANGAVPVYETSYAGKRIAFCLSRVGAPACVAGLEELIALGAKKLVVFGSCGVLDEPAVQGKIIIPSTAIRDEGTSYHYLPAKEEICADARSIRILEQSLEKCGFPYISGKTWTTDAIYRETRKVIADRKSAGCLCVEMECSAVFAVAQFRNVPVIQFLYGADNLDAEEWEQRDLTDYGMAGCNRYAALALECAVRL